MAPPPSPLRDPPPPPFPRFDPQAPRYDLPPSPSYRLPYPAPPPQAHTSTAAANPTANLAATPTSAPTQTHAQTQTQTQPQSQAQARSQSPLRPFPSLSASMPPSPPSPRRPRPNPKPMPPFSASASPPRPLDHHPHRHHHHHHHHHHRALANEPPPLPPRPIMLAAPRGSAVFQSLPTFQRAPLPPRPLHRAHSPAMHDLTPPPPSARSAAAVAAAPTRPAALDLHSQPLFSRDVNSSPLSPIPSLARRSALHDPVTSTATTADAVAAAARSLPPPASAPALQQQSHLAQSLAHSTAAAVPPAAGAVAGTSNASSVPTAPAAPAAPAAPFATDDDSAPRDLRAEPMRVAVPVHPMPSRHAFRPDDLTSRMRDEPLDRAALLPELAPPRAPPIAAVVSATQPPPPPPPPPLHSHAEEGGVARQQHPSGGRTVAPPRAEEEGMPSASAQPQMQMPQGAKVGVRAEQQEAEDPAAMNAVSHGKQHASLGHSEGDGRGVAAGAQFSLALDREDGQNARARSNAAQGGAVEAAATLAGAPHSESGGWKHAVADVHEDAPRRILKASLPAETSVGRRNDGWHDEHYVGARGVSEADTRGATLGRPLPLLPSQEGGAAQSMVQESSQQRESRTNAQRFDDAQAKLMHLKVEDVANQARTAAHAQQNVEHAMPDKQESSVGPVHLENVKNTGGDAALPEESTKEKREENQENIPPSEENAGNQRKQLKVEDALAYLEKVKVQFADQLTVYNQFLDIMKEFKAQSIDTTEVIRRVSDLFRGHKGLILGFNTFLPPGYSIRVTENKATGVLNTGFMGPEGFNELPAYQSATSRAPTLVKTGTSKKNASGSSPKKRDAKPKPAPKVEVLTLGDNALTGSHEQTDKADIDMQDASTNGKGGGSSGKVVANLRRTAPKTGEFDDGAQLVSTPPGSMKDVEMPPGPPTAERTIEFERAIDFVNTIKERFSDSPSTFEDFLDALGRFRNEQKGIRDVFEAVAVVFGPHKDLLQQFKEFLPAIALGSISDGKLGKIKSPRSQAVRRPVTKATSQVTSSRKGVGGPGGGRSRARLQDMQFFHDLKTSLGPSKSPMYTEFLKCLSLFTQRIVRKEELVAITSEMLTDFPETSAAFLHYLDSIAASGDETAEEANPTASSMSSDGAPVPVDAARQARYLKKPVSEMGSEFGVATDTSYRLLPPDFPFFEYSGRSPLEKKTLNDMWVSVTSGSEDYSFKFMRKNPHEDNLFRCEDDRYELDMLIETNASTIMKLQTIVGTMSKLPLAERKRHALAAGALSAINFNAIQRIYGEHGAEVIAQLKANPAQTVPVILTRLRVKDAHWRQARLEMNRVWREVGEKNYHKSLDHRSLHFKQSDKKELSAKSLLSDILDPAGSMAARDAEMTRARGYSVPGGCGGANNRSLAIKAVMHAAQNPSELSPPSLELRCEEVKIHRIVLDLIQNRIFDETASEVEAKRVSEELRRLLGRFFDLNRETLDSRRNSRGDSVESSDRMVLYGDEAIYLLFRLYHILFERIMEGLRLSREQVADREKRGVLDKEGAKRIAGKTHIPQLKTKPSALTKPFNSDLTFSLGPQHGSADDIFAEFLGMTRQFIKGKVESASKFEERCRVLLGAGSFCLLTLDKTVAKTAKQVMTVFGGDTAAQGCISLFHRCRDRVKQSRKGNGLLNGASIERVYSEAAVAHIGKTRGSGANVMRFQSVYSEGDVNRFVIHVVGKTNEEATGKSKSALQTEMERFLSFSLSPIGTETGRARTRKVSSVRGESRKRGRTSDLDFLQFAGSPETVRKRARAMDLVVCNELQWKVDPRGRLRGVDGQCDYMLNKAMKRPLWHNSPTPAEANTRSVWAKRARLSMSVASHSESARDEKMGEGNVEGDQADDAGRSDEELAARELAAESSSESYTRYTPEIGKMVQEDKKDAWMYQ